MAQKLLNIRKSYDFLSSSFVLVLKQVHIIQTWFFCSHTASTLSVSLSPLPGYTISFFTLHLGFRRLRPHVTTLLIHSQHPIWYTWHNEFWLKDGRPSVFTSLYEDDNICIHCLGGMLWNLGDITRRKIFGTKMWYETRDSFSWVIYNHSHL